MTDTAPAKPSDGCTPLCTPALSQHIHIQAGTIYDETTPNGIRVWVHLEFHEPAGLIVQGLCRREKRGRKLSASYIIPSELLLKAQTDGTDPVRTATNIVLAATKRAAADTTHFRQETLND